MDSTGRRARSYQQSLDLSSMAGDRQGQAWGLCRLGVIDLLQGRCQQAAGCLQRALALFRETRDTFSETSTLIRLGQAYHGLGHHEQATANLKDALAISRQIGARLRSTDSGRFTSTAETPKRPARITPPLPAHIRGQHAPGAADRHRPGRRRCRRDVLPAADHTRRAARRSGRTGRRRASRRLRRP
jgi:hypothetical protein